MKRTKDVSLKMGCRFREEKTSGFVEYWTCREVLDHQRIKRLKYRVVREKGSEGDEIDGT